MRKLIFFNLILLNSILFAGDNIDKIIRNTEINIFGFTYHFKAAKDRYTNQIGSKKYVLNPGIGLNIFLNKKYFLTFNYLKNCWNSDTYIAGLNRKFQLLKKLNFSIGINYIDSYYSKRIKKILPLYSLGFDITNKIILNLTYVPKKLSVNKKSEFLFFYLTYKLK